MWITRFAQTFCNGRNLRVAFFALWGVGGTPTLAEPISEGEAGNFVNSNQTN